MKRIVKAVLKWAARIFVLLLVGCALWLFIAYWTEKSGCDRLATAPTNPMKAVVHCEYGVTNLKVRDLEKPAPGDNDALIRVRAAALNPLDGHMTRGMWLMRLGGGLRKPKDIRIGVDYAGVVEAVGKNVTNLKAGDEVFGGKNGALAQYLTVKADRAVALKPANISFEQAGSVGVAALTALQGLRDHGKVKPGQKVIVNGASGGVGTFAVQIAKALGAEVTGVCSTGNIELVKSLGADHVIDYTKEDFTKSNQHYDVLFDNVQNHTFSERRGVLNENGICVNVGIGGSGAHEDTMLHIWRSFTTPLMSKFTSQKFVFFIAEFNQKDMNALRELMESGKMKPVIDRAYKSLEEAGTALEYLEQGHARGKVVVRVD